MRIGVLGTGTVGQTLASKLVELGHQVRMGARAAGNEKAVAWAASAGERAFEGSFEDAATFGELVVNATAGATSLEALTTAGADRLAGKVLVDVSNPLDSSAGPPPILTVCNDDSLGERIQRDFPDTRVVKTLNTVNAAVMVDPEPVGGTMFICGDRDDAKAKVHEILESFGWRDILDLGDIKGSRGMEMYVSLWLRIFTAKGTPMVNVAALSA